MHIDVIPLAFALLIVIGFLVYHHLIRPYAPVRRSPSKREKANRTHAGSTPVWRTNKEK